jgi:hypothetical protein
MASRSISLADAGKWTAIMGKEMRDAAERGLRSAGLKLVAHIQNEIIPETKPREPVDRGAYRAGWRSTPGKGFVLVHNTLPYASIIEYGARAANIKVGRKMIEALMGWVRRKGLATGKDNVRQAAWAIAMAMRKRGIFNGGKGLRVLERALKSAPRFIREEVDRELAKL